MLDFHFLSFPLISFLFISFPFPFISIYFVYFSCPLISFSFHFLITFLIISTHQPSANLERTPLRNTFLNDFGNERTPLRNEMNKIGTGKLGNEYRTS